MSRKMGREWPTKQLGEIVELNYGTALRAEDRPKNGKFPVYGSNGIVGTSDTALVPHPTIIIGRKGAVGQAHLAEHGCWPIDTTFYTSSRSGVNIDLKYLLHFLRSRNLGRLAITSTIPGLNRDTLRSQLIPVPPISEQERIVRLLDAAEELRRLRVAADRRSADLIPALFYDMFGDPTSNRMRWEVVEMREILEGAPNYGTMIPPSADGGEWLDIRVANIRGGVLDLSDRKYVALPTDAIHRHEVRAGDLLVARAIGSYEQLGKCIVADPGNEKWAFDSHLMRVRFRRDLARPEFVRAFLTSPGGRRIFLNNTRKSAVQFNINVGEFSRIRVPLPELTLQFQFAARAAEIRALEAQQAASRRRLDDLFQSMLHRAFRGEL